MEKRREDFCLRTPLGSLRISLVNSRLYSISRTAPFTNGSLSPQARKVKDQINRYFLKQNSDFHISLFHRGTDFQRAVWKKLQKVPYGQTVTYKELAQKLGKPKGARAIGQACAKNPFLIVVPCHRVVAQSHLGGFALGLKAKRILLKGEGPSKSN
ncbi:MAG: methylated-DNA--[protein]-cysteine S-methyltransferase [Bdellovibrionales bacterium]|nr:methylated-DNA--[protein]-cysteine S-methyltransferase [Bdellovibrionales bacterium]